MRAIAIVLVLAATASCSAASFDTAGAGDDDGGDDGLSTDSGVLEGDVSPSDTSTDTGGLGDGGGDRSSGEDGARDVDDAADTRDAAIDDLGGDADGDTCTLHDHFDPLSSKSYASCLPTGVLGDPSTYSSALLDDEIAFAEKNTPGFTWGTPTTLECDGESCTSISFSIDGGVGWATWCSTGTLAGYFIETTLGGVATCPIITGHGGWR
jgi:hypothetical protein